MLYMHMLVTRLCMHFVIHPNGISHSPNHEYKIANCNAKKIKAFHNSWYENRIFVAKVKCGDFWYVMLYWRSLVRPSVSYSLLYPVMCRIIVTSSWTRWRLKSPGSPLFTQPFIQAQIKENIKAPRHWPLCGEFTGDRWIPRTNGQ